MALRITAIAALMAVTAAASAQSNIDPANAFAWGENIGWTNWQHDTPESGDGVVVQQTFLSGFAWGENVGWMNLGDGSPGDGSAYANVNGDDFGVNLDPVTRELSGLAWGENIGWINFSGGALADPANPARLDPDGCRLRGYAWGENIGWINLDDGEKFIALVPDFCQQDVRGDANCDGFVNFNDIDCFVAALIGDDTWRDCAGDAPCEYVGVNDINLDHAVNFDDIDGFIECLVNGECP